jgi:hypothetical protein
MTVFNKICYDLALVFIALLVAVALVDTVSESELVVDCVVQEERL